MPDIRRSTYGTTPLVKNPEPEIFTVHVTFVSGHLEEFGGVVVVKPLEGFLAIVIEDGSTHLIPAHRIANAVVTPGRD